MQASEFTSKLVFIGIVAAAACAMRPTSTPAASTPFDNSASVVFNGIKRDLVCVPEGDSPAAATFSRDTEDWPSLVRQQAM